MSSPSPLLLVASERSLLLVGAGERRVLLEGPCAGVAIDPSGGFWAISDRDLLRGEGDSLRAVARAPAKLTAVTVFRGGVYLGVEGPSLWRFTDRLEELPGFAKAEGHEQWHQPTPEPPKVRSFAATGDALYVNVHVGGVLVSTDGERYAPSGFNLHDDAHEVRAAHGRLWAAAAEGLWTSEDGGQGFRVDRQGLPVSYLRACAFTDRFAFVSAAEGPFARTGRVFRRPIDGGRFEPCAGGLPTELPGIVDTHGLDAQGRLVAIGSPDGAVYLSEDEGESFSRRATTSGWMWAVRFLPAR